MRQRLVPGYYERVPHARQRERVLSASGVVLLHFRFVFFFLLSCCLRGVALPVLSTWLWAIIMLLTHHHHHHQHHHHHLPLRLWQWQWQWQRLWQQTEHVFLARKRFGLQFDLI